MIVTISGTPGSGKSSVGKALAKRLGYKFYSAGDVRGKYALSMGLTIDELNKKAETDPKSDFLVDEFMKSLANSEDDLVIDARLGFFFIPKSVKMFIDADPDIRAQRAFKAQRKDEKYSSANDAKNAIDKRIRSDIKRYAKLYGVNPYDTTHYELILDSSTVSINDLVGQAYRFAMFKSNPAKK